MSEVTKVRSARVNRSNPFTFAMFQGATAAIVAAQVGEHAAKVRTLTELEPEQNIFNKEGFTRAANLDTLPVETVGGMAASCIFSLARDAGNANGGARRGNARRVLAALVAYAQTAEPLAASQYLASLRDQLKAAEDAALAAEIGDTSGSGSGND